MAAIYKDLTSGQDGVTAENADIRVNSSAADAQLAWVGEAEAENKKRYGREDLEAYETAYNAGCVALARGEMRESEFLLKTARGGYV